MKKKKLLYIFALVTLAALTLLFIGYLPNIKANILLAKLRIVGRDNEPARAIGYELSKTREGIDACIKDMNIYGGQTHSWSSMVLLESSDTAYIKSKLDAIISGNYRLAKKLEACFILWHKCNDKAYLVKAYEFVMNSNPKESPYTIEIGRKNLLAGIFYHTDKAKEILDIPATENCPLSVAEFENAVDELIQLREQMIESDRIRRANAE